MRRMLPAPGAELRKVELALHLLLVLRDIIIPPLANGTAKPDEIVRMFGFGHSDKPTSYWPKRQT